VLNSHRQPVPIGVAGELHLGGSGVALGYAGRPDLTAERFVPDPLGNGDRLYRTGDLARYRDDGLLRLNARTDEQIKIRGFRIEPAEIEAALQEHPSVGRSIVVARSDGSGDNVLIAFVLPAASGEPATEAELARHLRRLLPQYMLPARIVTLAALPLTATGKVDRAALSVPVPDEPGNGRTADPNTPTEHLVCDVFSRSLGRQLGVLDDFFEFGGDSLRAMRVVAELSKLFGMRIPVRAVFDEPTSQGLAEYLDRMVAADVL
jgi:hypothetical protein